MKSTYLIRPYIRSNRWFIIIGIGCLITVDFLQLAIPRIIKAVVDQLTALSIDTAGLLRYAAYIVAIALLIAVFRYVWRICLIGLSREVEEGLRNRLFSHLQTLSASYFNRAKTGDLMAHATNDIQHIRMATGMGLVALTDAVVLGITTILFMAYINLRLTLFVIIPMPIIVFGTRFFSKRMHKAYQEVQGSFSDLTEVIRERFAGIRIIKAYTREAEAVEHLETRSRHYISRNIKLITITGAFFPMMVFFSNISLTIVIYLGGRQTIYGVISPGDFAAFISYLGLLTWPMMAMGWVVNLIQRGTASLDRIDHILQTPPGIQDGPDPQPLTSIQSGIGFEGVGFRYQPGGEKVLSGIDLQLHRGSTLGIVGPPGSGKTTLLNLIPRVFDASEGRILVDGADIRRIRLSDLRSMIAFVPQEPFLFAGAIRENITFDAPDITEQALERAVKNAALQDTIQEFPRGLETVVGEKGVILSGGQKQRIALARALLRDGPVLILDDPISQVDMETGRAIIQTIQSISRDRTVIIVSHRLSALRFADRIITLRDGRITESGSHEELMKAGGYYADTFRLQEIEEELHAR
ncbi:MAG: ABC transporter ATP-binding protein [Thermodesulfobacteriota bacterium]